MKSLRKLPKHTEKQERRLSCGGICRRDTGSSNPDHITENYDIFDFELTEEEMQKIADLDTGERYETW